MTDRAFIGSAEAVEAEVGAANGYGDPFTYAEMIDGDVIATAGFATLAKAKSYALRYGWRRDQIEVLG